MILLAVTVLLSAFAVTLTALSLLLGRATGRTLRGEPETRADRTVRRIARTR